jgi:ribosomal protein S18 acetylase RimI-like enzyme
VNDLQYRFRTSVDDDEQFLRRLREQCYREVVIAQFGEWDDDVQRGFFDKKWNPERYQIIETQGTEAGAVAVEQHSDHVFLSGIQISPEHQNRGLGTQVIEDIVQRAHSENLPVRLQVLKSNRAQALYRRLGFREIGQTDTHLMMERAGTQ